MIRFFETCRFRIDGSFECKPKHTEPENFVGSPIDISMRPRPKCRPCNTCPYGTYCSSCTDCKTVTYQYGSQPVNILQCNCRTQNKRDAKRISVLGLNTEYCDVQKADDISNCDGHLKCGACGEFTIY